MRTICWFDDVVLWLDNLHKHWMGLFLLSVFDKGHRDWKVMLNKYKINQRKVRQFVGVLGLCLLLSHCLLSNSDWQFHDNRTVSKSHHCLCQGKHAFIFLKHRSPLNKPQGHVLFEVLQSRRSTLFKPNFHFKATLCTICWMGSTKPPKAFDDDVLD